MDRCDFESAITDEDIELKCDNVSYCISKESLVSQSDYFQALYSGKYTDSDKTCHDLSPQLTGCMVFPLGLKAVVDYFKNPLSFRVDGNVCDVLQIAKTASYLQCTEFEEKIWKHVYPKLTPDICFDTVKHLDYESQYTGAALELTMSQIMWKFSDGSLSSDINSLETHEMFWLLRNPLLQDPTGGLGILGVVDEYVDALVEREKEKFEESKETRKVKYLSLFLHAYIVGASTRIDRTYTFHFSEKGTLSLVEQLKDCLQKPDHSVKLKDLVDSFISEHRMSPEYYFYLSESEKKLIDTYMTHNNVFKRSIQIQRSNVAWLPCSVIFKPNQKCDINKTFAITYDPISKSIHFVTEMKYWFTGTKVDGYGSQIILLGGENKIGSNCFPSDVNVYDIPKRSWTCIDIEKSVSEQCKMYRRSFATAWWKGNTLLLAGGYGTFRKKSREVTEMERIDNCPDAYSKKKEDSTWVPNQDGTTCPKQTSFKLSVMSERPSIHPICCLEVVHDHLFLFGSAHKMELYCPISECWKHRVDIGGWPNQSFTDAFAYGAGIYLISSFSPTVYWMLTDVPEVIPSQDCGGNLPLFEIIPYGQFEKTPLATCRVENILYSFTQDLEGDVPVIQSMYLEHNPLENLKPKATERRKSAEFTARKSDEESNGIEDTKEFESSDLRKLMITQHKPEFAFTKDAQGSTTECSFCRRMINTECRNFDGVLPEIEGKEVWRGEVGLTFQKNIYENLTSGAFATYDPFLDTTRKS